MVAFATIDHKSKQLIKAIQTCRRQVAGLAEDDTWRPFLKNVVGEDSLRRMSEGKLARVLDALHERGAPRIGRGGGQRVQAPGSQIEFIRQLWASLHEIGAADAAGDDAIAAFVGRMTPVKTLQWLDTKNANKVIEALKSWLGRARDQNRLDAAKGIPELSEECGMIWMRLTELGAITYGHASLEGWGYKVTGISCFEFYERQTWLRLLNRLRRWLVPVERKARQRA